MIHPLSEHVLRFFHEFSSTAADELTTVGAVLTGPDGNLAFGTALCYCGSLDEGEKALKSLRTFSPPLSDLIERRPYVEMQSLLDAVWPPGRLYYNKAHNLRTLSEAAAQTVVAYARSMPTTVSNIAFQQLHGAASRASATETAFPHRYDHYDFLAHPATDNPADCERMIQWARECWAAMQPFAEHAVYVNALEDAVEEGERRVREAYGPNYERLVA